MLLAIITISSCTSKTSYAVPSVADSVSKIQIIPTTQLVSYVKHVKNELTTGVGLILGVPNVTGFNGAKNLIRHPALMKKIIILKLNLNQDFWQGNM